MKKQDIARLSRNVKQKKNHAYDKTFDCNKKTVTTNADTKDKQ